MPKRKTPEEKPEEQFKRFIKTAKEHGVEESGDEFERTFTKVSQPKSRPRKTSRQGA